MGVRGLSSYIIHNYSSCMKPHELSDCTIVIDGCNIAFRLLFKSNTCLAFGGDYDQYSAFVEEFLSDLKKCNVSPIFLFDGGSEQTKVPKRLAKKIQNFTKLKSYRHFGFSRKETIPPLFIINVFMNVVRCSGFPYIQCDWEADGEIAAVAAALNCPVLSDDSDFFIHNSRYIFFNTIKQSLIKRPNSEKYYMKCSMYHVDDFLKAARLDKPLLYLLVTLLGNDHVESELFFNFFHEIGVSILQKNQSPAIRICELINWLRGKDLMSAKTYILSCLGEKAKEASLLFENIREEYTSNVVSRSVLNELSSRFGKLRLLENDLEIGFPPKIAQLFAQGKIPGFFPNITEHQLYLTLLQIEDVYDVSSHEKCLGLIKKIYTMIFPYVKVRKPLQVYFIIRGQYTWMNVEADLCSSLNLDKALREPLVKRMQLLCDITGVPLNYLETVPYNSWALFVMSLIYWAKEFGSVSQVHVQAFVIMMIANQVVQRRVNNCRNSSDELSNIKHTGLPSRKKSEDLREMLENVELSECVLFHNKLLPLRKTRDQTFGKDFSFSTVHLFNSFQTCFFYINIINSMLDFPLPESNIKDFYSGTLLHKLYTRLKYTVSVTEYGSTFFSETPNLYEIYIYLCEDLWRIIQSVRNEVLLTKERIERMKI